MPGFWGCFGLRRQGDGKAAEEERPKSSGGRRRSSRGGKKRQSREGGESRGIGDSGEEEDEGQTEQQGGDTVTVPKWEERMTPGLGGDDSISKPKPVRVHLRRPSSLGLGYRVGLLYDERMQAHYNAEDPMHPEKPERISAIYEALQSAGIVDKCEPVAAREATTAELSCVHGRKYIDSMRVVSKRSQERSSRVALARKYNSIYFNEGSSLSAFLAAGSCVELALKVARGELGAGAALVRPPGHHAEAVAAMGFCLFNNVAVAAHYVVHSQPALGIKKVLIVDWDVHHGNGTQHMFWKDPFVLYFSIHRHDQGFFYPTSEDGDLDRVGEGAGKGFNVNVPWPRRGYGDLDYLAVFDHLLIPIAQEFDPDMVFISAGFDSAVDDPLGGCRVTPAGYFQMTQRLMSLAGGRVVLSLEGGYNLTSLASSYLACMKALLGESCDDRVSLELRSSTWSLIKEVRKRQRPYWSSLAKPLPEQPPEHFDVAEDEGMDSAYQDSVSVSEADDDEDDVVEGNGSGGGGGFHAVSERKEQQRIRQSAGSGGSDDDLEHPGDLLSQLRTLDRNEEVRRSSVQRAEIEGIVGGMSGLTANGEGQGQRQEDAAALRNGKEGTAGAVSWEDLLDETSKHYRDG